MKKLSELIRSRYFFVFIIFLIQLFVLFEIFVIFKDYFPYFYALSIILTMVLVVHIVSKDTNPAYKIAWIIPILVFPVVGGFLYLFFAQNRFAANLKIKMSNITRSFHYLMETHVDYLAKIEDKDAHIQSKYLEDYALCPVCQGTNSKYYPVGEAFFEDLIVDLKNAKSFIFLEFFIIHAGHMWDTILEILEMKVKEGVDVRVLYDDVGCFGTLPRNYYKTLRLKGIKANAFNPVKYIVGPKHNSRDHRKIVVIDGYLGYTGGANIADEYINKIERFGHWKDTAVRLHGKAVWNLTVMFISIWNSIDNDIIDFKDRLYSLNCDIPLSNPDPGFIQPFSDSPLDNEPIGENIYLTIINRAKEYVYITTPYLIMTNEMITALTNAAKGGVDVRIVLPGIPDKKMVFRLTRSYYEVLLQAGVKIYEYKPGFMHAKSFVSDDKFGIVGTINMDYRSLYLHFENAVWFYNSPIIMDMKKDLLETIDISRSISLEEMRNIPFFVKVSKSVLRVFSPML